MFFPGNSNWERLHFTCHAARLIHVKKCIRDLHLGWCSCETLLPTIRQTMPIASHGPLSALFTAR